ncbi:hypothetical protein [Rice orange leaf phytoplasma]|uniref:hypothetical protein n=1 Tax=Rice orange leaf phytoplasma TaxID=146897 RepID=UPI0008F59DE8|nr:hypothetical protein [Rice orange leaf phytoplasma]OIJ45001.1 hypothetical protein BHE82_00345 [Rice orange leaf phytoplasma]
MEQYDANKPLTKFSAHPLVSQRCKETNDDIVNNINFANIIGMETEKETCNRILAMVSHPEWFQKAGKINKPKRLLLHGIPGKGKTLLAIAFMSQARQTSPSTDAGCFEFTPSDFITKTRE